MRGRHAIAKLAGLFLFLAPLARAHDPFENTVIATLQHGRLEVVVIMAAEMGEALLRNPANPENPPLNSENIELRRGPLEQRSRQLYRITTGGTELAPERVIVGMTDAGHLKLVLLYPAPTAWPLKFRILPLSNVPLNYAATLDVSDEDGKILGHMRLTPANPAQAELTVDPNPPAAAPPGPAPSTASPPLARESPASGWPESDFALGVALLGGALTTLLVMRSRKNSRNGSNRTTSQN